MPDDPHSLVAPYALDALDELEERDFEQHLALCEPCREELAGLREAAASLAYGASGPAPPPELKNRILAQARAERENVVSLPSRRRNWTAPLTAAAAIAAAAAIGLGIWGATRSSDSDPVALLLSQPGAKLAPLSGGGKLAYAPSGDAILVVRAPHAPKGKTYETWVIQSGKPTPAGLFPGGNGASIVRIRRPVRPGSIVAVTLERAGGVPKPTTKKPLMATGELS